MHNSELRCCVCVSGRNRVYLKSYIQTICDSPAFSVWWFNHSPSPGLFRPATARQSTHISTGGEEDEIGHVVPPTSQPHPFPPIKRSTDLPIHSIHRSTQSIEPSNPLSHRSLPFPGFPVPAGQQASRPAGQQASPVPTAQRHN